MAFDPARVVRDFGDIEAEVLACRTAAALFDFSFVARARIEGPAALATLGRLTPRELGSMAPGDIRYALRIDGDGHLVSDLTVWMPAPGCYELMSGRNEDVADLISLAPMGTARDLSPDTAILAVQGPATLINLARATDVASIADLAYYRCRHTRLFGVDCLVGRLGYTGEAGFEIVAPREHADMLRARLAELARPAGFAAADILRIEAGFVLFANEFQLPVRAAEAGLQSFSSAAPAAEGDDPLRLVAFRARAEQRPILWRPPGQLARPLRPGTIAVTSACQSRLAGAILGLGYARADDLASGCALTDPWRAFSTIEVVPRPFYDSTKSRPRARWDGLDGMAT